MYQPTVFEFRKGCVHVFANDSFLSLQMPTSEFAMRKNMCCKACFGNSQSHFLVLWKMWMQFLHVGVHRIVTWHKTRLFENDVSSDTFSNTNTSRFPLVRDLASGRRQPMFTIPTAKSRNAIFPRSVVQMVAFAHMTDCFLYRSVGLWSVRPAVGQPQSDFVGSLIELVTGMRFTSNW